MTPDIARAALLVLMVGWYLIRFRHARRSRRTPVDASARGWRETVLLIVSTTGLGIVPALYVATGFPAVADTAFRPWAAWLGIVVGIGALVMFRLTHKALGRNWSVSLELREGHRLVSDGVYRWLRHPMYTAFWMWALAQALLLPNWIAGPAGLVGFGILFFGRIGEEERMMEARFGDEYRDYASKTDRVIPGVY